MSGIRKNFQDNLEQLGWTKVRIPKDKVSPEFSIFLNDNIGTGRTFVPAASYGLDDTDMWHAVSWFGYINFYFKEESDAMFFKLRFA